MSEIWTQHEIGVGEGACFQLGQLCLWARRSAHDWSLAWQHLEQPAQVAMTVRPWPTDEPPGDSAQLRSFAFPHSQGPLVVSPMLADRPVIVRPQHEITVAPKALVQLYLTTALWVDLRAEGGVEPLMELPSVLPKPTWFGPSTLEGELCYAGRLPLRHHGADLVGLSHRAITPLLIRNRSSEPLQVQRFRVPVPRLSLFQAKDGGFWTSRVSVLRREGGEHVDVEVLPRAPDEAGDARLVAAARSRGADNVVSRALGSVFSQSLIP